MEQVIKQTKGKTILQVVKGALIAVIISLIGILFFAFLIKLTGLPDSWIMPINQVIKGISILLGVIIALKSCSEKGMVKGLAIGLIYTLFAFLIFSMLNGSFSFDKSLLNDVLFGTVMGGICGIIAVSARRRR